MSFRLFAAAAMTAIAASLGLIVCRAFSNPLVPINPAETDAVLLHHLGLGQAGSLLMLPLLLRTNGGFREGLLLGGYIFLVFCLFPWLSQPQTPPGQVPAGLGLWLFSVAASTTGLWLLWRSDWQRRLTGLVLLILPLLLGYVLADRPDVLTTSGFGEAGDPDIAVWRDLALNLLFWLLLGAISALTAHRVVIRKPASEAETGP